MAYAAKFLDRETLAGDVTIYRFEKPAGFEFKAGQWCLVTVPDMGFQDDRGLRRPFSIAASPLEKDLIFATKQSGSAMKRTMAEMARGTVVDLGQPMGSLFLPEETKVPLVFLAGGVGITPFRSMMLYVAERHTGHRVTLFYSSRTPEETPFLDDFSRAAAEDPGITLAITMTRATEGSSWKGLRGRLSPAMIKENCTAWESAAYYIVGPPAMADTMKQTLGEMDIPSGRITVELFAGY